MAGNSLIFGKDPIDAENPFDGGKKNGMFLYYEREKNRKQPPWFLLRINSVFNPCN